VPRQNRVKERGRGWDVWVDGVWLFLDWFVLIIGESMLMEEVHDQLRCGTTTTEKARLLKSR